MSAGLVFAGILSSLISLTSLISLIMISIYSRRQWKIQKEMRDLRMGHNPYQMRSQQV